MNKFVINFVPTGMMPNKNQVPSLPISPEDIAKEVIHAKRLGVSIVHLHARDSLGNPTWSKQVYKEIIDRIRDEDGYGDNSLIICVSTSGRNWPDFKRRSECLELKGKSKPDMASLTLGSLNFPLTGSLNSPDMIKQLALKMKNNNIKPELEVFDIGMINYAHYLKGKGMIEGPFYFNLLFGNISTAQANMLEFGVMQGLLPNNSYWSTGGIGSDQLKMNVCGIINGGGIRIGLEDNIFMDTEKRVIASNIDLLDRINQIAKLMDYKPYEPSEVREMLNLKI